MYGVFFKNHSNLKPILTDYGFEEREVYDEIDKIHAWQQRLKEAINQANKTDLIEL